jgi:hypothetical protein
MKSLAKRVYRKLPFTKRLFSLVRRIVVASERVFRHLDFTGEFEVPVSRRHSLGIHFNTFHRDILGDAEAVRSKVIVKRPETMLDEVGVNRIDLTVET